MIRSFKHEAQLRIHCFGLSAAHGKERSIKGRDVALDKVAAAAVKLHMLVDNSLFFVR